MVDLASLGSDIVAGATALGGLQLVFLGNVTSSFSSFSPTAKSSVRAEHRAKALQAFLGVAVCLLATGLALFGKWAEMPFLTYSSALALTAALFLACYLAYQTFAEID